MNLATRFKTAIALSRRVLTLPAAALAPGTFNEQSFKMLSGEWEGGETSRFRNRRPFRLVSQDTDLGDGTREKMMSEARWLCQTFPIADAILERFADYCVHPDAKVKFTSPDHDWNRLAEDYWFAWVEQSDAVGCHTFPQMLRIVVKGLKRDGDSFLHKEHDGLPKLLGIEADRITNARGGSLNRDVALPGNVSREVGGVKVDAFGRKLSFTVCDRSGYGSFINPRSVPASEMLHCFSADRFESYRGVTAFHPVLNDFRDLKETHDAEKLAVKIASVQTLIERNHAGAQNKIDAFGDGGTDAAGNARQLEDLAPGLMRYLGIGEDVSMFKSERPAEGWRWFMSYMIRGISVGLHLPFEFVWDLSGLGGAGVRLMSKQAERTFRSETDNLESRVINPTVAWVISDAMLTGRLPFNPRWHWFAAQRPAHPTVDVGRESTANINELNAGVISESTICGEQGFDDGDVRQQRAAEVMHRIELAKEITAAHPELTLKDALAMLGGANIGPTYNMQAEVPKGDPLAEPEEKK